VTDAEEAYAKKDYRFIGILGLGRTIPGVSNELKEKYGFIDLNGTSDCGSSEHARLQNKAMKYAEDYNRLMSKKLLPQEGNAKP